MTQTTFYPKLSRSLATKSGKPLLMGTGSGTKWKDVKRATLAENPSLKYVQEVVDPIKMAIENGFYHIDTAEVYGTHSEVAEAIKQTGVKREDLFITTKWSPGFRAFKATTESPAVFLEQALKELNTDYIDLYLLHLGFINPDIAFGQTLERAYQDLINAKKAGKVRYIGVSNSTKEHLQKCMKVAGDEEFFPVVNQIEFHPYLQNQSDGILEFSKQNNILLEAYGPLTPLFRVNDTLDHPLQKLLPLLSAKYHKTDAQILLRYTLQKGLLPVTTSSKPERVKESLQVYEFELDQEDVDEIDRVGSTYKYRGFFDIEFDS